MQNETLLQNVNTGFLAQPPLPSDFIAGAETGIVQEDRLPSADWTPYLPTEEAQIGVYFDTMACVTFSALNVIEAQMNFLKATGKIPADKLARLTELGFFDANGNFNASDRFTAKMSGTTRSGNYLVAVWDSIRNHGILPEKDWAYPRDQRQPVFDWDDYYAEIPQALKNKALEIKEMFEIKYEWLVAGGNAIPQQFFDWLRMGPIQLATAVCSPWNTDQIIKSCGLAVGHATKMYRVELQDFAIFDHYKPFRKRLALDYRIPYAMRGVVYVRDAVPSTSPVAPSFKHAFNSDIRFGVRSEEVKALQNALKRDGVFPGNVELTGYYGDITRLAVIAFQKKYRVASPQEIASLNGKLVGPKTRTKLNELFNR